MHPNRRKLGAKCRRLPKVISAFDEPDHETLWSELQNGAVMIEGYEVSLEDVERRRSEREGFAALTINAHDGSDVSLVLDMKDTPALLSKGLARDITLKDTSQKKRHGFGYRRHQIACLDE